MKYDYLIVGGGLFGAVFAREMSEAGRKCLVVDKRDHIGGNCYTEDVKGINVHKYGPHIFHTSNKYVWEYVNKFAVFNHFVNRPKVSYGNHLYSFPINLATLNKVYGVVTPEEARAVLEKEKVKIEHPANLEEWCLSQIGENLYNIFVYGYTKKQWGREPKDLPQSIIKRLPVRLTYDDNYFNDVYQGIPVGGYTPIFEKLLAKSEVKLNTDYFSHKKALDSLADKVLYTGMIDEFYDYRFGELEYRGLRFEHEEVGVPDYQGVAVVNYTSEFVPYTRIVEHSHFQFYTPKKSYITREYPAGFNRGAIPYYPIGDKTNSELFNQYKELATQESKYIFGGRLANYQYHDMHQIIPAALKLAAKYI